MQKVYTVQNLSFEYTKIYIQITTIVYPNVNFCISNDYFYTCKYTKVVIWIYKSSYLNIQKLTFEYTKVIIWIYKSYHSNIQKLSFEYISQMW